MASAWIWLVKALSFVCSLDCVASVLDDVVALVGLDLSGDRVDPVCVRAGLAKVEADDVFVVV